MRHRDRWIVGALVAVGLLVPGCRELAPDEAAKDRPANVEPIEGTDLLRVTLTAEAAERLDIQTAMVEGAADGQTIIPYAAVFYGLTGETWAYTSPEPLAFVRQPITVDRIEGELAYLSEGPSSGTVVVTIGSAELFGVETGIGE